MRRQKRWWQGNRYITEKMVDEMGKETIMTLKNYIRKGLLTAVVFILIGYLGKYFYMADGEIDWFRFALLYGILMGIPHMLVVVPLKWDISGTVGMVAFCVLIGGLFGCIIAVGLAVRAAFYLVGYPVCLLVRTLRKSISRKECRE